MPDPTPAPPGSPTLPDELDRLRNLHARPLADLWRKDAELPDGVPDLPLLLYWAAGTIIRLQEDAAARPSSAPTDREAEQVSRDAGRDGGGEGG